MELIFIPGSGCSLNVWGQQTTFFDNSTAINLPGHPDGEAIDSVSGMADWLMKLLDQRENNSVVLVGHSLGSAVVLQAAIKGHVAIKGLVLIGAGSRLKVMPMILSSLTKLAADKGDVPDAILAANQGISEPLRSEINESMKDNGIHTLLSDFSACNEFDVSDSLNVIKLPTQIIVGKKDVLTPPKYAEYLAANIEGSSLSMIDEGTHMALAEQPLQVNTIIKSFIDSL
jgi:pimeloyl-ACP methyl ester carboxylesterase